MERDQCWSDPDWCSWLELVFACLIDELPTGFTVALWHPFVLLIWFGEEWNTSITKFLRSRAGESHPCVNLHSREITSASVELCETEVCFLHIQLIGTNVCLPKMHMSPPDVDFESPRSLAKSESWNNPDLHCCAVFHTWQSVWVHMCDEYISTSKSVHGRCNTMSTNTCQIQAFQNNLWANFYNSPTDPITPILNSLVVVNAWCCRFV